jgi:hypothetical protein
VQTKKSFSFDGCCWCCKEREREREWLRGEVHSKVRSEANRKTSSFSFSSIPSIQGSKHFKLFALGLCTAESFSLLPHVTCCCCFYFIFSLWAIFAVGQENVARERERERMCVTFHEGKVVVVVWWSW